MKKALKNILGKNILFHGDTLLVEDVSNKFTGLPVGSINAYSIGELLFISLRLPAPVVGWSVIATGPFKAKHRSQPLLVMKDGIADDGKDIDVFLDINGQIRSRVGGGTNFSLPVNVSGIVMINK